jgi:hypothetical protein
MRLPSKRDGYLTAVDLLIHVTSRLLVDGGTVMNKMFEAEMQTRGSEAVMGVKICMSLSTFQDYCRKAHQTLWTQLSGVDRFFESSLIDIK